MYKADPLRTNTEKLIAEIAKKRSREKQLYSSIEGVQRLRRKNETDQTFAGERS